jgi:hypothetical protein
MKFEVSETEKIFALKDKDDNDFEPSAIEPINERYFLMADDKDGDLFVLKADTGEVVQALKIKEFKKPKWEALAFDGEYFYIIGSHAVKLDSDDIPDLTDKLAKRSHLLRFKLKNTDGDASAIEIHSVLELNVSDSLREAGLYDPHPKVNKVKIEGLAVRITDDGKKELFFALREPHDLMRVYAAALPAEPKANDKLDLKPFFSFEGGKIGTIPFRLSSIEYVPQWNGFFALTSTEDAASNAFSGNALWFVSDEILKAATPTEPIVPQIVWLFAVDMKAEGLCVLPEPGVEKLQLAIVYDNDFKDTTKPGKLQIIEVTKK